MCTRNLNYKQYLYWYPFTPNIEVIKQADIHKHVGIEHCKQTF